MNGYEFRASGLVAAIALLTLSHGASAEPTLKVTPAQRDALGIEVTSIEATPLVSGPPLPGHVLIPNDRSSIVSARTAGVVLSLAVATGEPVAAGQTLAEFESPGFVLLQREFLDALSQRDLADATFERERQLADEGIVAGRRALESQARQREAHSLVEERRQALRHVGMDDDALESLARSRRIDPTLPIRAPVEGFVLEQWAHVGERLEAGSPLYRIGRLDALQVEIHVPVDLARRVAVGSRFSLVDRDASGRVIVVGRGVHTLDQGVLVRGLLESGLETLRPGQFVRVVLQTEDAAVTAFAVPNAAVSRIGEQAFVFRSVPDGYEPVPVDVLAGSRGRATIAGPLASGERLVTRGTAALKAHWLSLGGPN
ncbi:MAG: efflux RND transporter periplasmic adaptor subunit [Myxococcota bacterium]